MKESEKSNRGFVKKQKKLLLELSNKLNKSKNNENQSLNVRDNQNLKEKGRNFWKELKRKNRMCQISRENHLNSLKIKDSQMATKALTEISNN